MSIAKMGDTVRVHYNGSFTDGEVFDSSEGREPLEFTLGEGQVIPGFEKGIVGMNVGDNKILNIKVPDAYGEIMNDLIIEVDRRELPPDFTPAIGDQLQLSNNDGTQFDVVVKSITAQSIILDANHPLAGKDLNFEINLVEIIE